ncbi:MAG: hypothetical protein Q8O14_03970 [bacterium]|nr:hypothetical protein [bacterium]
MSPPAARQAALEEWIALGRAFLLAHRPGAELDAQALTDLLQRRDELLPRIDRREPMDTAEAEAALRLKVIEEELVRRVEQDLERRRRELDELDQTRRLLHGYATERDDPAPPARFLDMKS